MEGLKLKEHFEERGKRQACNELDSSLTFGVVRSPVSFSFNQLWTMTFAARSLETDTIYNSHLDLSGIITSTRHTAATKGAMGKLYCGYLTKLIIYTTFLYLSNRNCLQS